MRGLEEIRPGVINMLKVNMGIKNGETVLVINDVPMPPDWQRSFEELVELTERSLMARSMCDMLKEQFPDNRIGYLPYPVVGQNGAEPPADVAQQMMQHDVALLVTTYSLSHTRARENATRKGVRIASMPGIEQRMFAGEGPMAVDYEGVQQRSGELAELLTQASLARVTTPRGTDLELGLNGRAGLADTGMLQNRGDWGNLPGGEAYIAPAEGTVRGKIVVPAGWYFHLDEDMLIEFEGGQVISVRDGGKVGDQFRNLLFGTDSLLHRRNCAELGIGTNPKASKPDNVLEAEKIKGTVHIAIGDSSHMGGTIESDIHEDFVLPEVTLYLDGKAIAL
jgi:leucyl aminopeptidase (aminopeptidase T)